MNKQGEDTTVVGSVSVVIPVYRGEATVPPLLERLAPVLARLGVPHEVVLVNDGSPDRSWEVVTEMAATYPFVHAINLMRNYGQHNALLCGVRAAKHEVIVTMDDDLQHPPEEIPALLAVLGEGYDVVYGTPRELPHSLWRNLFSKLTKRSLASAMGARNVRDISAFRAFRTHLRKAFENAQPPNVLLDVLLSWGTTNFGSVTVNHLPRREGRSNYNFSKLVNHAMLILTGFSTTPLRLASLAGFAMTLFGVLVLAYVVGRYLWEGSIPGFPFLASIIVLFSGTQLFALGIFGEYLARIFNRSSERPTYVIKESAGGDDLPPA